MKKEPSQENGKEKLINKLPALDAATRAIKLYEQGVDKKSNHRKDLTISEYKESLKFISQFDDAYLKTPVILSNPSSIIGLGKHTIFNKYLDSNESSDVENNVGVSEEQKIPAFYRCSASNESRKKKQKRL